MDRDKKIKVSVSAVQSVKLNCRYCNCGRVWVPKSQSIKVVRLEGGWYKNKEELVKVCEHFAEKVSIRFSISKRGRIVCPNCKQATNQQVADA